MTCHLALVLELNDLGLLLAHWDELEVDNGLELNIGSGHQGVKVELVWLSVTFREDLDHVMEVAGVVSLELHAHFDGEAGSDATDVLVLTVEALVVWLRKHDTAHVLGDIADRHSHFIVLVWLNI